MSSIKEISDQIPGMSFHFEMEQIDQDSKNLINSNEKFYLVYDTGNLSSYYTIKEQIKILEENLEKIKIVHLKDKDTGISVRPGRGKTPFNEIFSILRKSKRIFHLTIQTARDKDGCEVDTICNDLNFFKKIYEQNF